MTIVFLNKPAFISSTAAVLFNTTVKAALNPNSIPNSDYGVYEALSTGIG
jgi:hypothetical protein